MPSGQLRLLLWKDFLIRKRNPITLAGIIWAALVVSSLLIVRVNIDNQDYPTCQFPARALPSAGLITFTQSLVCSISNECRPMDEYQEIPTYENSRLTQLQRKFSPLLFNESVLSTAETVPHALALLATGAAAVDEPTFLYISQHGLRLKDLFRDPDRTQQYLGKALNVSDRVIAAVMDAELSFQGLLKGHTDRCNPESLAETILIKDEMIMRDLVAKICPLPDKQIQDILMNALVEIDFGKYIRMIGNMFAKLNGDTRLTEFSDLLSAIIRMSDLQSFVPPELISLLTRAKDDGRFHYYDLTLITKVLDQFEPTFGNTEEYKTIRNLADSVVTGIQWFHNLISQPGSKTSLREVSDLVLNQFPGNFDGKVLDDLPNEIEDAVRVFQDSVNERNFLDDVFDILPKIANFILRFIPKSNKHEVLFYSTLLTKLIEEAENVIVKNINMESITYNVSMNNPEGVKILVSLPPKLIGRAFEGLTDAERTQLMTSKLNTPSQMFCETSRLEKFLAISKQEAEEVKTKLCKDEWSKYVADLIEHFGIFSVKNSINEMAGLVIQETIGRDTSEQLYTLERVCNSMKRFIKTLQGLNTDNKTSLDWSKMLNVTEDSELMKTLKMKGMMGKQILITVHGALAKEIVKQNTILDLKISPILSDLTTLVSGLNQQLQVTNRDLVEEFKNMYPVVLETMLKTLLHEDKAYKLFSTPNTEVFCTSAVNASVFLQLPPEEDAQKLLSVLCRMSNEIENGLKADSVIGKTLSKLRSTAPKTYAAVDWTKLITGLKDLYTQVHNDYPYIFEHSTFNMADEKRVEIQELLEKVRTFWFSQSIARSAHLSLSAVFRILDLLDHGIFNLTEEAWLRFKHAMNSANSLLVICDEFVKLFNAISNKEQDFTSDLPPTTVIALREILPNIPSLIIDVAQLVKNDSLNVTTAISALNSGWPCVPSPPASPASPAPLTPRGRAALAGLRAACGAGGRGEWTTYQHAQNVRMVASFNENDTTYMPHLFLKFSSNFDALVKDTEAFKTTLKMTLGDQNFTDDEPSFIGAWAYAVDLLNDEDRNEVLLKFAKKIDLILNSVEIQDTVEIPLNTLWEPYMMCSDLSDASSDGCQNLARGLWRYTFKFFSVMAANVADDLSMYLSEFNDPKANLLQIFGFTKDTGLHVLFDKLPDFLGVLLNSYFDYGFMNQIRRASRTQFWDCSAVVEALVIPPSSRVTGADLDKVKPFLCPSILYWLSLPRGENKLLDLVAKPQYYFYNIPADNLTSQYENALENIFNIVDTVTKVPTTLNMLPVNQSMFELKSLQQKLSNIVDNILDWRIDVNDTTYRNFYTVNKRKFTASVYLTRITAIISKIQNVLNKINVTDIQDINKEDVADVEAELNIINKKFKRKPSEAIALHMDLITDVFLVFKDNYTLTKSLDEMCKNIKSKESNKNYFTEDDRFLTQICSKKYELIYDIVQKEVDNDVKKARNSLLEMMQDIDGSDADMKEFFSKRKETVNSLKAMIKYADDLGMPIFLRYLQTNIQHYDVILSFLSGGDWWKDLRNLYNGSNAKTFFGLIESSLDIAEDFVNNVDRIHIVRLLRDINLNDTEAFCQNNVSIPDYLPDSTNNLSMMKNQACNLEGSELMAELPIMVIVSQGFDITLTLPKTIDYTALEKDISKVESKLDSIADGPQVPSFPQWITKDRVESLRKTAKKILSKEVMVKTFFGFLNNVADAATLYINGSTCKHCSTLTTWLKQLNLQLYKKQEYDNLYCHVDTMDLEHLHQMLTVDFHWDMALRELISTRNYTKYELNKSVNEFLDQMKVHLLDDLSRNETKLAQCLAQNVTRNGFGNATLFASILSRTVKLLRAEVPHLHEIPGLKDIEYLKKLSKDIAPRLHVTMPLIEVLKNGDEVMDKLRNLVNEDFMKHLKVADIDLLELKNNPDKFEYWLKMNKTLKWDEICASTNCTEIKNIISNNLIEGYLTDTLPKLQSVEFWRFPFVSSILHHIESTVHYASNLLSVVSRVDLAGVLAGNAEAMLDFLLQITQDDCMRDLVYGLRGICEEIEPLVKDTLLEFDLKSVIRGLTIVAEFKIYVVENVDLKIKVSDLFSKPELIESRLEHVGINNTNFWSVAAPRIRAGHIDLKPLLTSAIQPPKLSTYVCQSAPMSAVIRPADLGPQVTEEDVFPAVADQFCGLDDNTIKTVVPAMLEGMNFSYVMEKATNLILDQVYQASNLTQSEGNAVLSNYPQMVDLLPVVQSSVGDLGDQLKNDSFFSILGRSNSLGSLLSSSEFLSSAGNMLCGRPFPSSSNKFFKTIVESEDFSVEEDPMQLEALPTDFCRALYRDVLKMSGGKILWSFVKPLLMGQILYTPDTATVRRVITQANATFAHVARVTSILHEFAATFPAVKQIVNHKDGVQALSKFIGGFGEGIAASEGLNLDGIFNGIGDLDGISPLLSRASSLLRCVSLNRFHPTLSQEHLTSRAANLTRVNEFSAGLIFDKVREVNGRPMEVNYTIRMDIDSVPTTSRIRNQFWTPGPEANFLENMHYFRGFLQVQDLIDNAIVTLAETDKSIDETKRMKREATNRTTTDTAVYTQQIPYPCYRRDYYQSSLYESQAVIVAFFFAFVFSVCSIIRHSVVEKEQGNTLLLSCMGVNIKAHTISWLISSFIELLLASGAVWVILHSRVLTRSGAVLMLVVLVFSVSCLCYCYMVSKMFKSASLAAVCGGVLYLVTFMPYVIILSLDAVLTTQLKLLTCLFMSTSFSYCLLHIARLEAEGSGAGWTQLWLTNSGQDLSLATTVAMMIVDSIIYLAIGYVVERFYGIETLKSSITYSTVRSERPGISAVNLTKVYHPGTRRQKVALDNVSVEMHSGQITTFLGHNGAGKTTLLNIITGVIKPTSGRVVRRGGGDGFTSCGVCPQRDVLYERLTPAEHVSLYQRLRPGSQWTGDQLLEALSLPSRPAHALSGGLRRRLCVGLAFSGAPSAVVLDEPTSGVDPASRRDIWDLILKLKETSTVIMTTHHMDEAELLSDQIVIMHQGQVHTVGSPVEVKRSLGSGYRLTLTFPAPAADDEEDLNVDERGKAAVALVRTEVKNAQVMDVGDRSQELLLPFYTEDGLNTDFQRLCSTLESHQDSLGLEDFTLECSTLEQVLCSLGTDAESSGPGGVEPCSIETPSKSVSSSSVRTDCPLVPHSAPLKGSSWAQCAAILKKRLTHYRRNRWLQFLIFALPILFVTVAMGFSMIRPPADNEIALKLTPELYEGATRFVVPEPSRYQEDLDPSYAEEVMRMLTEKQRVELWTPQDTPTCECSEVTQVCNYTEYRRHLPAVMSLPNVTTLNDWLIASQHAYIEKRYGGHTSVLSNNRTNLIAWYNNKGHHAAPSFLSALSAARLKRAVGAGGQITTYTHPMKISDERLTKSTLLQHVADAGISGLLLVAFALVPAGTVAYLVDERRNKERTLQLLCGVTPGLYAAAHLLFDMGVMLINAFLAAAVLSAFGFPVFVAGHNLPAVCILLMLFGLSTCSLWGLCARWFADSSLSTMLVFCANVFVGLSPIAILLILDIISESEATDNARWTLHKIFMCLPQFAFADGLLEIAKNTVQAQVLIRFGMDTYKSPLTTSLIVHHYVALLLVAGLLFLITMLADYGIIEDFVERLWKQPSPPSSEIQEPDVAAERKRVEEAINTPRLLTLGNINAGYTDTEGKQSSLSRAVAPPGDVIACLSLYKTYPGGKRAVKDLTLGLPIGECTALLGENGAGKSSTFSMLCGELRPTGGRLMLHNSPASRGQLRAGDISYCPQSDALDPLLTVRETLSFYCKLRGIYPDNEVIDRTLSTFDLTRYSNVRCSALSGGNKRRLCTAVAFMGRNSLVLLDEPTSGMDPAGARTTSIAARRRTNQRCGSSVLVSTHVLGAARSLARRLAAMHRGELVAVGTVKHCLYRFGGGYTVSVRGPPTAILQACRELKAKAVRQQILVPKRNVVDGKEVTTRLSDIFRVMSSLRSRGEIDDYTVSLSSLDQMFLALSNKIKTEEELATEIDSPSIEIVTDSNRQSDDLDTITSL